MAREIEKVKKEYEEKQRKRKEKEEKEKKNKEKEKKSDNDNDSKKEKDKDEKEANDNSDAKERDDKVCILPRSSCRIYFLANVFSRLTDDYQIASIEKAGAASKSDGSPRIFALHKYAFLIFRLIWLHVQVIDNSSS